MVQVPIDGNLARVVTGKTTTDQVRLRLRDAWREMYEDDVDDHSWRIRFHGTEQTPGNDYDEGALAKGNTKGTRGGGKDMGFHD